MIVYTVLGYVKVRMYGVVYKENLACNSKGIVYSLQCNASSKKARLL